ncbi:MAG: hypothetical protein OXL96_00960 [Candidatus Poribacteria bacterium]|nr:hypothetical protein [Candidatus Poribacteria bacterium]
MKYHNIFLCLILLLATQTIDAREPWPPKGGLGKDLPKELSAAYWYASDIAPRKFLYPDEVERLFYDFNVRNKFSFLVARMLELAKRGNGRILPADEGKLKVALDNFLKAFFTNKRFLRLSKLKQRQIVHAVKDFAATEIAGRIVLIHSLAEIERFSKQKKNQSR